MCRSLCRGLFTFDTRLAGCERSGKRKSVCKLLFLLDRDIHIKKKKKRKRGSCVSVSEKIGRFPPANSLMWSFTHLRPASRSGYRQCFPPPYLENSDTPDTNSSFALQINKLGCVFLCQTFFSLTQGLCQTQNQASGSVLRGRAGGRGLQAEGTGLGNWLRQSLVSRQRGLGRAAARRVASHAIARQKKRPAFAGLVVRRVSRRLVLLDSGGRGRGGLRGFARLRGLARGRVHCSAGFAHNVAHVVHHEIGSGNA